MRLLRILLLGLYLCLPLISQLAVGAELDATIAPSKDVTSADFESLDAGPDSVVPNEWDTDPQSWSQRGRIVRQVLEPAKYDFESVGYKLGSVNAVAETFAAPESVWDDISSAGEFGARHPDAGFGNLTLNWVHHQSLEDVDVAEALHDATVIEQLQYRQFGSSDESSPSLLGPYLLSPEEVFSGPVDPTIREYQSAPVEPVLPPPEIKTVWREYADWIKGGFLTWTERLELGGTFLEGNTNQEAFNTAARFSRDTELITTQINIGGNHAQSRNTVTQNRWYGDTTSDFKRSGKWLYFIRTLHEYDQFTNLDYRGTASFGMGYRFFNEEYRKLIVRYGPGVTQEVFHSPRVVRTSPDMFAEFEMKWPLGPRVIFEEKATLHPNITNFEMLRVLNTTGFLIPLDDQKRWNLKVGFRYEYNGRPNGDRLHNDFATNVNIVYSRK